MTAKPPSPRSTGVDGALERLAAVPEKLAGERATDAAKAAAAAAAHDYANQTAPAYTDLLQSPLTGKPDPLLQLLDQFKDTKPFRITYHQTGTTGYGANSEIPIYKKGLEITIFYNDDTRRYKTIRTLFPRDGGFLSYYEKGAALPTVSEYRESVINKLTTIATHRYGWLGSTELPQADRQAFGEQLAAALKEVYQPALAEWEQAQARSAPPANDVVAGGGYQGKFSGSGVPLIDGRK